MKNSIKKVLVTGGAGCIGMQVCNELIRRKISVCLFDLPEQIQTVKSHLPSKVGIYYGSILDCSSLRDAMVGCDAVIHLAAYLGVRRTETNRLRCIEININGTQNVLDCAIQQRLKKIVFASSSEVYGEPFENPVKETTPTQGKTVYAVSKLAGEELCKAYNQKYPELSYTILRYFNTYGPFQIAQFVIPKFVRNAMENKAPVVYGDGRQKRSYCYSSDTAWATVEALTLDTVNGQTINVGNSSAPMSLMELAKLVVKVCGKEGKLKPKLQKEFSNTDRTEEREIFVRFCDTTKAGKLLNFVPKISVKEGIRKMASQGTIAPKWQTSDYEYTLDEWV